MHPILFDFGWHTLPLIGQAHLYLGTYGVFFALSVLLAWFVWLRVARRDGLPVETLIDMGFYTLFAGLIGSKVGLILTNPSFYLSSLWALATTVRAAGVLLVGVLAAILTMVIWARRHHLPIWAILDSAAPSLALGQAIGRLGCLAVGCCYGRRAPGLPWGIRFTDPNAAALSGTPLYDPGDPGGALNILHPTQIYQAGADFLLFLFLLWMVRRRMFMGARALLFIAVYSITRGFIEFYRGDIERGLYAVPGTSILVSTSQLICAAGLVVVVVAWPILKRRGTAAA
jgi:phosphatidylglycerol:prolipoprotein diacylglycerol transferase